MRPGRLAAAAVSLVAAAVLTGCGDEEPMPVPTPTPSATSDTALREAPPEVDPRCVKEYGARAGFVYEGDIRTRPDGFPTVADFAVLCFIETLSPSEQAGHYATTYYTPYDWVLDYYEKSITGGAHGRADSTDGLLLTGVVGDASFYIVETGTSRYAIHWAIDGDYRE